MQYIPDFTLSTPSRDITEALNERISSIDVIEYAGMQSDQLILVLDDHIDYQLQLPDIGHKIRVTLGYKQEQGNDGKPPSPSLVDHGEYEIAEYCLSGARDTLTIYANKLMMSKQFKAPKYYSWQSPQEQPLTLQSLIDQIAAEYGLQSRVNPELGQVTLPQIEQSESDMQLLSRLAGTYDATFKVVEDYLIFMPRSNGRSRTGQDLPVHQLTRTQLMQWQMLGSGHPHYQSCKAHYYDWNTAQRLSVSVGSGTPQFNLTHTLADEQTATQAAQARLNDFKRCAFTLRATTIGKPELFAGGMVEITKVRDANGSQKGTLPSLAVDGRWCLTKVHHRIDSQGFISHIEGEKATQ